MHEGKQALEQIIDAVTRTAIEPGRESAEALADRLWPEFRRATAAAIAEIREEQAMGVKRWQDARHPAPEGGEQ